MGVCLRRRQDRRRPSPAFDVHRLRALHHAPAVVAPALDLVDHLPQFPADVADPEVAGGVVDAHPPRVAEAERPDLGTHAGDSDERIIGRDAIRLARLGMIDVDAEDAREQVGAVLAGVERIGRRGPGAVAGGEIQAPVVAEVQAAAVVAARPEPQDHLLALRVDHRRIGPARGEPGDDRAVGQVVLQDVADVDVPVLFESRMEREPVQGREVGVELGEVECQVGLRALGSSGNEEMRPWSSPTKRRPVPPARTSTTGNWSLSRGNAGSTVYGGGGSGVPVIFEPVHGTRDDRPLPSSRSSPAQAAVATSAISDDKGHPTVLEAGEIPILLVIGPWVLSSFYRLLGIVKRRIEVPSGRSILHARGILREPSPGPMSDRHGRRCQVRWFFGEDGIRAGGIRALTGKPSGNHAGTSHDSEPVDRKRHRAVPDPRTALFEIIEPQPASAFASTRRAPPADPQIS